MHNSHKPTPTISNPFHYTSNSTRSTNLFLFPPFLKQCSHVYPDLRIPVAPTPTIMRHSSSSISFPDPVATLFNCPLLPTQTTSLVYSICIGSASSTPFITKIYIFSATFLCLHFPHRDPQFLLALSCRSLSASPWATDVERERVKAGNLRASGPLWVVPIFQGWNPPPGSLGPETVLALGESPEWPLNSGSGPLIPFSSPTKPTLGT